MYETEACLNDSHWHMASHKLKYSTIEFILQSLKTNINSNV